jgi:hypothetical protein
MFVHERPCAAPLGPVLAVSDVHGGHEVDDPAAGVVGLPKPGRIGTAGSLAAPGAAPAHKSRLRRALDAFGAAGLYRTTRSSYGEQHGAAASLPRALPPPPDQLSLCRHAGTQELLRRRSGFKALDVESSHRRGRDSVRVLCCVLIVWFMKHTKSRGRGRVCHGGAGRDLVLQAGVLGRPRRLFGVLLGV